LVRHGPTEWSESGRHTSTTDLPLLPAGEEAARGLAARLGGVDFSLVLTSPRLRARRTAELAGYPEAVVDDDLVEWGYGDYEGVTTPEIRETVPGWTVWTHPSPGGETASEVGARLDRVVARAREVDGRTLVFAHGHSLRVLAARWLGLDVAGGRLLRLDTATISVLGNERETPVVLRWNC
jgi:probable phosphoglycerate mutase